MYLQTMYGRPSKRMRRIKPVARVGAIDVNVRYDIYARQKARNAENNPASDECYDIHEGEVLYKPANGSFYRDNSLHVLSCTNGQGLDDRAEVNVCGVAVTGFSPRTDVYEQGFVLQVSGLTSIYNNSNETIVAGQPVYVTTGVDADRSRNPTGVPRGKRLLVLNTAAGAFLGTCVKGGASKSTIDVVLHRCGDGGIPAGLGDLGARFETLQPPAARQPAAAKAVPKAKKSKAAK